MWEEEIKHYKDKLKWYKDLQKSYRKALYKGKNVPLINKFKNIFYNLRYWWAIK